MKVAEKILEQLGGKIHIRTHNTDLKKRLAANAGQPGSHHG